jgi:predicted negative regulator of RcsB-dependent stress response
MKPTRSAFAGCAAVVIFAGVGAALPQWTAAAETSPLVGTWKFVPEKSKSAPYKSATLTISDGGQTVNVEGIDTDGKPVKASFAAIVDGKPHPINGMSAFDSGMWTRNSDTNASFRYSKGKNIVVLGTRVLSADGSTLTFREQMYDSRGKPLSNSVITFLNPDVKVVSLPPSQGGGTQVTRSILTADETAGGAALAKGDNDEAIRLFTKVIDTNKPSQTLSYDHVSRGVAYAQKSQYDQAYADFDAAVKLKPDDMDARLRRGETQVQLKHYKEAIDDLSAVIKADASKAEAYRLRGFSYNVLGDDKSAGADYDKACSLNKDFCI